MLLKKRLSTAIQRFRQAAEPRLGKVLLSAATRRAQKRLSGAAPLEILIDNSVLALAVTHESRWISTGLRPWGPHVVGTGYMARVPVRQRATSRMSAAAWRDFNDSCFLVGIAHLARLGLIRLKASGELRLEQWRHPSGRFRGYGIFDLQVFRGIEIGSVDGVPDLQILPKWMGGPSLEEQQRARLRNAGDPLFQGLLRHLGEKNSQDAWHIRTAEVHGLFCFLTTDHALCRNVKERCRQEPVRSLRTKVLTPSELGLLLGLRPLDPKWVTYENADFPVRADIGMLNWSPKNGRHEVW